MRICVAHETVYRYDPPCTGAIQTLRLTPRNHAGQYVVNWRIDVSADCRLEPQQDAFGNITHAFSVAGPLSELRLLAEGEVETQNAAGVVRGAVERFPPTLFLRDTPLTHADKAILVYAREFPRPAASNTLATLHELLTRLHQDITFDAEAASGAPSAADAFKAGRGTSQDLAHIFIAVARALGVPARYVAGYFRGEEASVQNESLKAGHAWAEVHVPDLGWVGFDPANGVCATDQHVRVAVGLDYLGAAPVRGAHYGGGPEDVAVKLSVTQASWQTQG
ncbi:MAG TPA: transglutaminase family protein [Xanthobacteraceae bacterium]|jgi:transglutaminase-like putative cysteine protease|nr:transglutaminase family protein [Xanthobacteraceae bacterium]